MGKVVLTQCDFCRKTIEEQNPRFVVHLTHVGSLDQKKYKTMKQKDWYACHECIPMPLDRRDVRTRIREWIKEKF